jgi:serine/threonine protein kinase
MGEVYRATDTNLRRAVAIKILPSSVSSDPDRLARFHREAQVLASLNHPHIAQVHGLEKANGITAIAMELVDGPTLADRIARGAIPVTEAVAVAKQIAEALEAAHDQEIIHRDLKPANIKVRPDGRVKVLDFGLAKTLTPAVSAGIATQLPTVTSSAMTLEGAVLGTAAYMSPEQARGLPLDKRSDIWAFGCVLFEMLTGRRAFAGQTIPDTIAAVLERDPSWQELPPSAMPLAGILRRCLEKDRNRRLREIGDVRQWLDEISLVSQSSATARRSSTRAWWIAATAVLGVGVGGLAIAFWTRSDSRVTPGVVARFELTSAQSDSFSADIFGSSIAISPDGSRIVYTASRNGVPQLVLHHLDRFDAIPLAGTEGATYPFFSVDGKQIGYATLDAIKRLPADGGPSLVVCPADAGLRGATWGPDDVIVFAHDGGVGLLRVPASGGAPQKIATPDPTRGEENYLQPALVPDSDVVLYTVTLNGGHTRAAARRLTGGDGTIVAEGGSGPQYVPPGYVVFGQDDRLMAVRFDPTSLKVAGVPALTQENVFTKITDGVANVSVAADGTTAFVAGHNAGSLRRPIWVDRQGMQVARAVEQPLMGARNPRLSPDGRRLALVVGSSGHADIWIYDLTGAAGPRKLTFKAHNTFPVWSSDGKRIFFLSITAAGGDMFSTPSDGSSFQPERVTTLDGAPEIPLAVSPDGTNLLFRRGDDLWLLNLTDRKARVWLPTPFNEHGGRFSPTGRSVAYSSNRTGRTEIYVSLFPGPGAPVPVSSDGGHDPVWSRDGKEIFYENGGKLMAARVISETPELRFETPRMLFEGGFAHDDTDPGLRFFDSASDGRLLMIEAAGATNKASIVVVKNWTQELDRLVPAK